MVCIIYTVENLSSVWCRSRVVIVVVTVLSYIANQIKCDIVVGHYTRSSHPLTGSLTDLTCQCDQHHHDMHDGCPSQVF